MTDPTPQQTMYVAGEGRDYLDICMAATFAYCRTADITVVVVYTSNGDGPCRAVSKYLSQSDYSNIRLVAVTPPANRPYRASPPSAEESEKAKFVRVGVFGEKRKLLTDANVPIVSARLPFHSVLVPGSGGRQHSQDPFHLVDCAFGVLGGGFSFCIQVALVACDAGAVRMGERIAVMSADTALAVTASHSESFLSPTHGLLVEHIICRPAIYNISKSQHFVTEQQLSPPIEEDKKQLALELPASSSDEPNITVPRRTTD